MERILNGMQSSILSQPFYSFDFHSISLHCKDGTRLDWFAIHLHGTRSTRGGVTANMRAGHVQVLTQEMHEQQARLNVGFMCLAINRDLNMMCTHFNLPAHVSLQGAAL